MQEGLATEKTKGTTNFSCRKVRKDKMNVISGQAVWMRTLHSQGEYPMWRVAPCLGVLPARMTPTAQAGWKSWNVSAPGAPRKKHRLTDIKSELNETHEVWLPASHQLREERQQKLPVHNVASEY